MNKNKIALCPKCKQPLELIYHTEYSKIIYIEDYYEMTDSDTFIDTCSKCNCTIQVPDKVIMDVYS